MLLEKDTIPLLCLSSSPGILLYDNLKPTAIQRHSLPKAQLLEDGRLVMPVVGFDDDINAHRRAAEHKGKRLLAFHDTVEVIGWVLVTRITGQSLAERPYEEVSAEARTANLTSNTARG